jgi:hypothetical protein
VFDTTMLPPGMVLVWRREESATSCTQDFALKNPGNPYIMICDRPKIAALKKEFPDLFVSYKGQHTETNYADEPWQTARNGKSSGRFGQHGYKQTPPTSVWELRLGY